MQLANLLSRILNNGDIDEIKRVFDIPVDLDDAAVLLTAQAEIQRMSADREVVNTKKWEKFVREVMREGDSLLGPSRDRSVQEMIASYHADRVSKK